MQQHSKIVWFFWCVVAISFSSSSDASFDDIMKYAHQLGEQDIILSFVPSFKKFICYFHSDNDPSFDTRKLVFGSAQHATLGSSKSCEPTNPKEIIDLVVFVDYALEAEIITVRELRAALEKISSISCIWKLVVQNNFLTFRILLKRVDQKKLWANSPTFVYQDERPYLCEEPKDREDDGHISTTTFVSKIEKDTCNCFKNAFEDQAIKLLYELESGLKTEEELDSSNKCNFLPGVNFKGCSSS